MLKVFFALEHPDLLISFSSSKILKFMNHLFHIILFIYSTTLNDKKGLYMHIYDALSVYNTSFFFHFLKYSF